MRTDNLERLQDFIDRASGADPRRVRIVSQARLPSRFGDFTLVAFRRGDNDLDDVAIIRGDVSGEDVPMRLHSECLTGDALGSLRCDCRDQLEAALTDLGKMDRGLVLYMRQEGRGIGLANKVRAYALQDQGLDTVDANLALGFADDQRDYQVAAQMLQCLGVRSVQLKTNNPKKVEQLGRYGVAVTARIAHQMPSNGHNHSYLQTKARRSGHLLEFGAEAQR